jgi:hypothetical protein
MKNKKKKVKKDLLLDKLLDSKLAIVIAFILIILFYGTNYDIINRPFYLFLIQAFVAFIVIVLFQFWRYKKHTEYYKRKFKDKVYLGFIIFATMFFSFCFAGFLNSPVNNYIKHKAQDNPTKYYECYVWYVSAKLSYNKVHFTFIDGTSHITRINLKKYGLRRQSNINIFEESYDLDNLKDDYVLCLEVKKSIFDTYIIEDKYLKKK